MWSTVSASQLQTFSLCQRKWVLESVLGIKSPATPAQQLGTDIHAILEDWQRTGKFPPNTSEAVRDEVARAETVRHYLGHKLPKPKTGLVEQAIHETAPLEIAGVPVRGYIDLRLGRDIYDYKTTSSYKYIKSEDELASNIQLIIYAYWVLMQHPEYDSVTVHHIYILTRGKPAEPRLVSVELARTHVEAAWEKLIPLVEEMQRLQSRDPNTLPLPEESACHAYGGCFHWDTCHTTSKKHKEHTMPVPAPPPPNNSVNALAQRLLAAQGVKPPPMPVSPPDAPQTAGAPPRPPLPPNTPATGSSRPLTPPVRPAPPPTPPAPPPPPSPPRTAPPPPPAQRRPKGYEAAMTALGWDNEQIRRIGVQASKRVVAERLLAEKWGLSNDGEDLVEIESVVTEEPPEDSKGYEAALVALGYPISDDWGVENISPALVERIVAEEIAFSSLADDWYVMSDDNSHVIAVVSEDGSIIAPPQPPAPPAQVAKPQPPAPPAQVAKPQPPAPPAQVAKPQPPAPPAQVEEPIREAALIPLQPPAPPAQVEGTLHLYINAYSTAEGFTNIDKTLGIIVKEVEEELHRPWHLGEYGASKERGIIAARLRALVLEWVRSEGRPCHLGLRLDGGPLLADIVAALSPFATTVTRGF